MEVLLPWLEELPAEDAVEVQAAGAAYAMSSGPLDAWMDLCERTLSVTRDAESRIRILRTLVKMAEGGELDRSELWAQELIELEQQRGEAHRIALAYETLAEIREHRGDEVEALRIRSEEVLPRLKQPQDIATLSLRRLDKITFQSQSRLGATV